MVEPSFDIWFVLLSLLATSAGLWYYWATVRNGRQTHVRQLVMRRHQTFRLRWVIGFLLLTLLWSGLMVVETWNGDWTRTVILIGLLQCWAAAAYALMTLIETTVRGVCMQMSQIRSLRRAAPLNAVDP